MLERGGALNLKHQCALLGVSRSSRYYKPLGESAENVRLMRRIDEAYLKYPFYGSRQMARHLGRLGLMAGRHRVRRLMGLMGLEAIYRKPRTSAAHPDHRVYPFAGVDDRAAGPGLVRGHHLCSGISRIFLFGGGDGLGEPVLLAWRLSNTLDGAFCIAALAAALRLGTPEIFNTDQGAQFTSAAFTERVQAAGARCSMDGRAGSWTTFHRTAVALAEIRSGVPARAFPGRARHLELGWVLQRLASALGAGRAHTRRSLSWHRGGGMSASAGFNPADPPGTGRLGVHTPRIPPPPHGRFIRGETAPVASRWNTLQAPLQRPGGTRPAVLTPARFASTISFDEGTINQSKYTLKKPSDFHLSVALPYLRPVSRLAGKRKYLASSSNVFAG